MSYKHFQLSIMILIICTTFGLNLAYGSSFNELEHKDTNGYSPTFLRLNLVKISCQQAFADGWLLGYCSKELGTL